MLPRTHDTYNNVNSNHKTMMCGVPQGSMLGPLLFTIMQTRSFIRSLHNGLIDYSRIHSTRITPPSHKCGLLFIKHITIYECRKYFGTASSCGRAVIMWPCCRHVAVLSSCGRAVIMWPCCRHVAVLSSCGRAVVTVSVVTFTVRILFTTRPGHKGRS